ncbi:MAG: hypothetical protein NVS4B8_03670 [Herpetosiphon sp.]
MRGMIQQLIENTDQLTIVDMEASVEHMSRGTVRHVDTLLIVLEPYYRSLETASRMIPLADGLGIKRVFAIANKVRDADDQAAVNDYCQKHGIDVIATIPFDMAIAAADRAGVAVVDYDAAAPAVMALRGLAARIKAA